MRRLFYIPIFILALALFGWEDLVPAQAGAEERGGIEGTQTEYTQMVGGTNQGIDGAGEFIRKDWEDGWITFGAQTVGGTDFIWPPGGVAPFVGGETAGHLERTPRRWAPGAACKSVEPVIHVIELSAVSEAAVNEFWVQMLPSGECKEFPNGLIFWADEVVAEMKWGDGDPMYVVKGHDNKGFIVYVWTPAAGSAKLGVPPPGTSELIPLI